MNRGDDSLSTVGGNGHSLVDQLHPLTTETPLRGPHLRGPGRDGRARPISAPPRRLDSIQTIDELEQQLSEPTDLAVQTLSRIDGDIMLLGIGGKMGPTLARMAKRASELAGVDRRIIGVSRFSTPGVRESLESYGVETIACDLLDSKALARLPVVKNVIFMTAMKFGSSAREPEMWAMNCYLPAIICEAFCDSRIVAFSTGNVYGLTPINQGGSLESALPNPLGEYAMSCLGRERIFQHFSINRGIPLALLRLNYACELRYGVLVDLAEKVWAGKPIDLTMGSVNAIWQGDANAMALCALDRTGSPPFVLNVSGPELLSVRQVSEEFGRLLEKPVEFFGKEAPDALMSNGQLGHSLFGYPRHCAADLLQAVAAWIQRGGELLGKPTRFESRDGRF